MADDNSKISSGRSDVSRPRRVVTAPVECSLPAPNSTLPPPSSASTSTSTSASNPSARSEDLVETLYSHPSVKIIAFTSTQRASFGPRKSSNDVDRPGTLPASSRLERTIAVGTLNLFDPRNLLFNFGLTLFFFSVQKARSAFIVRQDPLPFLVAARPYNPSYRKVSAGVSTRITADLSCRYGGHNTGASSSPFPTLTIKSALYY